MDKKVLSYLGLARRGGFLVCGAYAVGEAVRRGKAALVIAAEDAGRSGMRKVKNLCDAHSAPFYLLSSKELLGHAIGKEETAFLAVTDSGLAAAVRTILDRDNG